MATRFVPPFELIPESQLPSVEVLKAGTNTDGSGFEGREYSDLFPRISYLSSGGVLGNYIGGDPPKNHPLHFVAKGLHDTWQKFAQEDYKNDFQYYERVSRGKRVAMLQGYIVTCIAKAYDNVSPDVGPIDALALIDRYVEKKHSEVALDYDNELDSRVRFLASLDRCDEEPEPTEVDGIPIISNRDFDLILGNIPESPEVERERRKNYNVEQIQTVRKRLERLRFEYLCAVAISQILKEQVL